MFLSLQTSNSPASTWPSPSKVAVTVTMQPLSLGSLTLALAFGLSGFVSFASLPSPVMVTSVAVCWLAFVTTTAKAGVGPRFLGFAAGAVAPGAAVPVGAAVPAALGAGAGAV